MRTREKPFPKALGGFLQDGTKASFLNGYSNDSVVTAVATIRDVARLAKVGISTVSRVINDTGYVSDATRARVLAVMAELNYQPNEIARSLKRKHTLSIGLALTDISNPFYGEVAQAVESAAREMAYSVLLACTGEPRRHETECIDLFLEKRVDGIIWYAPGDKKKLREVTVERKVPVVIITPDPDSVNHNAVCVNDVRGAFDAVTHLIRLGHRRIGYIGEPDDPHVSQERMRGYRWALDEHGIEIDPTLIVRGTFREGSATRAVDLLLDRDDPPTAIFAANDLMAIEAIHRLRGRGLAVPEDVAVVGFDDVKMAGISGIDLTTVSQPKREMGREAARLLISCIRRERPLRQVILTPHLIVRKSCGYHLAAERVEPMPSTAGRPSRAKTIRRHEK